MVYYENEKIYKLDIRDIQSGVSVSFKGKMEFIKQLLKSICIPYIGAYDFFCIDLSTGSAIDVRGFIDSGVY